MILSCQRHGRRVHSGLGADPSYKDGETHLPLWASTSLACCWVCTDSCFGWLSGSAQDAPVLFQPWPPIAVLFGDLPSFKTSWLPALMPLLASFSIIRLSQLLKPKGPSARKLYSHWGSFFLTPNSLSEPQLNLQLLPVWIAVLGCLGFETAM